MQPPRSPVETLACQQGPVDLVVPRMGVDPLTPLLDLLGRVNSAVVTTAVVGVDYLSCQEEAEWARREVLDRADSREFLECLEVFQECRVCQQVCRECPVCQGVQG